MSSSPVAPMPAAALDFGGCLKAFTSDPGWVGKLLVGSLITILGCLILPLPLLLGYQLRVLRLSAAGAPRPFPEWEDWGGLFVDGLKVLAVLIPHQLALFAGVGLPILAIMAVSGALGEERGGPFVMLLVLPLALVGFVALLAFAVYIQAALLRLAQTGDIAVAFQPAENVAFVKRNAAPLLLAFAVLIVTNLLAQFGMCLCYVGLIPTTLWSQLTFHYALGQVARMDAARG
jgi:hypothetical protein